MASSLTMVVERSIAVVARNSPTYDRGARDLRRAWRSSAQELSTDDAPAVKSRLAAVDGGPWRASPSAFDEMARPFSASLSDDGGRDGSGTGAAGASTVAPASALAALRRSDRAARASATTVEAFFSASMSSETPAEELMARSTRADKFGFCKYEQARSPGCDGWRLRRLCDGGASLKRGGRVSRATDEVRIDRPPVQASGDRKTLASSSADCYQQLLLASLHYKRGCGQPRSAKSSAALHRCIAAVCAAAARRACLGNRARATGCKSRRRGEPRAGCGTAEVATPPQERSRRL